VSNLKSVALTVLELIDRSAAHTQTDRHTHTHTSNEHIISANSLRSLGGDNKATKAKNRQINKQINDKH